MTSNGGTPAPETPSEPSPKPTPEPARTTTLALSEGELTADVAGPADGRPVLFLHGFPQTRYTWRHQLPALAGRGLRGIALDQRGYSQGLRPLEIAAYHVDRLVADVVEMVDLIGEGSVGARQVDLVGHDWGGQVAWLSAARHPECFRSLTVLSRPHPAAFAASFKSDPDQADRSKHHRGFDDPATADLLLADDARRLRRLLGESGVPSDDVDGYLEVLAERPALDAALNWYRAATGVGLRAADTPPVSVPTLYLWGNADRSVGRVAAEATADHVSGHYRFEELVDAGHFLTDDGTSDLVSNFLFEHLETT